MRTTALPSPHLLRLPTPSACAPTPARPARQRMEPNPHRVILEPRTIDSRTTPSSAQWAASLKTRREWASVERADAAADPAGRPWQVPVHRGRGVGDHLPEAAQLRGQRRQDRAVAAGHRGPGHPVLRRPRHLLCRPGALPPPRAIHSSAPPCSRNDRACSGGRSLRSPVCGVSCAVTAAAEAHGSTLLWPVHLHLPSHFENVMGQMATPLLEPAARSPPCADLSLDKTPALTAGRHPFKAPSGRADRQVGVPATGGGGGSAAGGAGHRGAGADHREQPGPQSAGHLHQVRGAAGVPPPLPSPPPKLPATAAAPSLWPIASAPISVALPASLIAVSQDRRSRLQTQ